MSTLSVWRFDTPDGADKAVETLETLSVQQLVTVHDAATVTWPEGAKKPKTRQLANLAGAGALGGAFWGSCSGCCSSFRCSGRRSAPRPARWPASSRTSATTTTSSGAPASRSPPGRPRFVLTSDAVVDRVREAFTGQRPELLFTNLSTEQENALREAFAD